ncbi:MAG TPA: hypothetical protein PKE31_16880 [Pseudomonadota bacterium]|nr:hypothetical protein [Pseudomonadota bacterium]
MGEWNPQEGDGYHGFGDSWRGPLDPGRLVSYGNWAGPGNRMESENEEYIQAQRDKDPSYDPYHDKTLTDDPRYKPVDGMDAAAFHHDHGYQEALGPGGKGPSMFGWEGLQATREADRRLVNDVRDEMAENGDQYSGTSKTYAKGLQGYFGARVMGQDAIDWAGGKAGEAAGGISNFINGAKNWGSFGDAAKGIGQGIKGAGSWLANTGKEAWGGISGAAKHIGSLGLPGILGAAGGFANVAGAGLAHLGGKAWDGVKSAGSSLAGMAGKVGGGILNGAKSVGSSVLSGAKSVGSSIAKGVGKVFSGW